MATAWQRVAYACELLLAIIAVFTLWSQAGGQGHLDIMAWYWKLGLGLGMSISVVALTAAIAGQERALNRNAVMWAAAVLLFAAAMTAVTYYYHVNEPVDDQDSEESTTAHLLSKTAR